MNKDACKYYISKGVSRIVLARECSREDIKEIIEDSDSPSIKPYYSYIPEKSMAIEDPDFSKPDIL